MDRRETDDQTRATKNTKNVWKWILGVGIVLMAIAFWGGFFNHDENFKESETPSSQETGAAGAAAADSVASDTIMENVRKTE